MTIMSQIPCQTIAWASMAGGAAVVVAKQQAAFPAFPPYVHYALAGGVVHAVTRAQDGGRELIPMTFDGFMAYGCAWMYGVVGGYAAALVLR